MRLGMGVVISLHVGASCKSNMDDTAQEAPPSCEGGFAKHDTWDTTPAPPGYSELRLCSNLGRPSFTLQPTERA